MSLLNTESGFPILKRSFGLLEERDCTPKRRLLAVTEGSRAPEERREGRVSIIEYSESIRPATSMAIFRTATTAKSIGSSPTCASRKDWWLPKNAERVCDNS